MTTMLEKMAEAMWEADPANQPFDSLSPGRFSWNLAMDQARAALLAIREPDEHLLEGVSLSADHTIESMGEGYPTEEQSCANIFTAMIDAILNGAEAAPEREDQEPLDRLARSFRERPVEQYEETFTHDGGQVLVVRLGPKRPS